MFTAIIVLIVAISFSITAVISGEIKYFLKTLLRGDDTHYKLFVKLENSDYTKTALVPFPSE